MADTLEIFGTEYTGVTGIIATTPNETDLTYIRPQGTKSISANGTGIDVAEYASVDVNVSAPSPSLQSKTKTYTPTETAQTESVSADSGYDGLDTVSISVGAISNTYVGTGITRRSSTDLTASGATVTVPSGYYSAQASKAVASGTAGTPTATKGGVSNHSILVTPSVTNTSGYITGSTKTGTAVTVSASELVSGSETKTANGTYDVTNLAELVVNVSGGGGGASNVVTGTFKGTTTGAAMDVTIPYTGSGYPLSVLIYPTGGPTSGAFDSLVQRYAIQQVSITKSDFSTAPTYSSSGVGSQNGALIICRYKNSSTSSGTYTQSGNSNNRPYSNSAAQAQALLSVIIRSNTKLSVFIASSSYGFAANIEYTYQILYSS